MELTKDADYLICFLYKIYLDRTKSGSNKRKSKRFRDDFCFNDKKISKWHESDKTDTLLELASKGLLKFYIGGDFDLTDSTIIYMENRFKNGFMEVSDFISKFIP